MEGFTILVVLIVLLILRTPIAVAAALSGILLLLVKDLMPLTFAPLVAFQSLDSFTLLAVPFFILAGQLMAAGGISKQILKLADELLGAMPGGYALTTVLASVLFAGLSGTGPGCVAAIGAIMIPAMVNQHYERNFAAAVTASAGCLAVLVPPSTPMVVYGIVTDTSIGRLFLAGFMPGILTALAIMITAFWISYRHGWAGTKQRGTFKEICVCLWDAKWALMVPAIILGGIYGGIFTPTESAAVACFYSLLVGLFVYKEYPLRDLPRILAEGAQTIIPIMFIIAMAIFFCQVITIMGIPMQMANALKTLSSNPLILMLTINAFLLIVGMFMETIAAIVLLSPILIPLVLQIGIDPVHFGAIMVVNLAIGFLSPPLGVNLFVASSIGNVSSEAIAKASIPFMLSMFFVLFLVIVFPQISLFLPNWYYGV